MVLAGVNWRGFLDGRGGSKQKSLDGFTTVVFHFLFFFGRRFGAYSPGTFGVKTNEG